MSIVIRTIDIVLSFIGIIIIGVFLPGIWVLQRLDSKGPLFYLADRVGKDLKPFKMYKFRTMIDAPMPIGECLCPQFDPRVTSFGSLLRRTKINELPQLINILKGDMSFVGPRPESPELAEIYPPEAKIIFSVKPGLVGPASINGRNEEECYPVGVDVKKYYLESLLLEKVRQDLKYVENPTLKKYFNFIYFGVLETIGGAINRRQIRSRHPQIYLLIVDLMFIIGAYLFSYNLNVWHETGGLEIVHSTRFLPLVIIVRLLSNQYFGLYRPLLRYISEHDIFETFKSSAYSTAILLIFAVLLQKNSYTLLIGLIDWTLVNILSGGLRFALIRHFKGKNRTESPKEKSRALIYGVCDSGNHACRALISNSAGGYEVAGFIDDAVYNFGRTINGKKVLGNRYHIKDLAKLYDIDMLVIADPHIEKKDVLEIISICAESKLKCGVFSNANNSDYNYISAPAIRDMEMSDILELERIKADYKEVAKIVSGKTIIINGSGGVMGVELCRRLVKLGCKRLVVIERYESYLNEFVSEIYDCRLNTGIVPVLLKDKRSDILEDVFMEYRPNIVIQAGLRKFISLLGLKISDVEENNYSKNFYLAKLAAKYDCEQFVMISSIFAKDRNNEIYNSLWIAGVTLKNFFRDTNTRFVVVPMCDIAESHGGIVSIIDKQVKQRGTLTLPLQHNNSIVISKRAAADLILHYMVGKKEDILDRRQYCGHSPVALSNIVQNFAKLYNLKLTNDISNF
jgi:FlaA1/EpsC-like NDP-sugar epimerase/lipopolysaccharide/colanic/teichoic acid biosynthesis glycosyltransferase